MTVWTLGGLSAAAHRTDGLEASPNRRRRRWAACQAAVCVDAWAAAGPVGMRPDS